jgi:ubiquinone/menaquinone biosynthesis C-methylase UbiE
VTSHVNTTYEPFSLEPEYIEANRAFVLRQPLAGARRILDLACGTGTVSELLLEQSPQAHLNGLDYDPVQVRLASERFERLGYQVRRGFDVTSDRVGGKPVVTFGVGSADALRFADATFDCVTIANAIHLLPDKPRFLAGVARVLKPSGVFGFNTAFYSGSMPAGTDRIYLDWLRLASEYIQAKSDRQVAAGGPPIKRQRGTARAAFANRWYNRDEWSRMLADAGLMVHDIHERVVELNARSFGLVGAYGGLAEVLLSGFPVLEAAEALEAAARPALEASNATSVPRNYLEIWATKQ